MQNSLKPADRLSWSDFSYFLEVARSERIGDAARRLGVDYTTVSRRIRALEAALGSRLFEKSRSTGFTLTAEGQRLLTFAEKMENAVDGARENVGGFGQFPSGHVRIGLTEGFGIFFLTQQLASFRSRYPLIRIDLLPVPRLISLSKHEADLAVTIERPIRGPYITAKLCDYTLRLYATASYLDSHPKIRSIKDLHHHDFIGYVDELIYSKELLYLERQVANPRLVFRSTSIVAQHYAVRSGIGLAILPCFMARQDETLVPVLPDEVMVTRSFWIYCHEELRPLRRIAITWDYVREVVEANQALLN